MLSTKRWLFSYLEFDFSFSENKAWYSIEIKDTRPSKIDYMAYTMVRKIWDRNESGGYNSDAKVRVDIQHNAAVEAKYLARYQVLFEFISNFDLHKFLKLDQEQRKEYCRFAIYRREHLWGNRESVESEEKMDYAE